jgi:hypothetical protein
LEMGKMFINKRLSTICNPTNTMRRLNS